MKDGAFREDQPAHSAAEEIVAYEREVREHETQTALRRFHHRTGYEPATEYTPLDSILAAEDDATDEWAVKRETIIRVYNYFTADGPHPAGILRRVFALGAHMAIKPFCDLTLREKKLLLGGSHGTHHWLMKKNCEDPLRRKGAKAWKAPGQKTLGSRKSYSHCQKGNTNRKSKKEGHYREDINET